MSYRILVVDDDKDFVNLLLLWLDNNDFDIDVCYTAKDAIAAVDSHSYGAIILDVSLPDYTGYYLGKLVRNFHPDLPILFLTNYDGDVTRENADDIHADVIRKVDILESSQTLVDKLVKIYAKENRVANSAG